jgi:hypothetical protein
MTDDQRKISAAGPCRTLSAEQMRAQGRLRVAGATELMKLRNARKPKASQHPSRAARAAAVMKPRGQRAMGGGDDLPLKKRSTAVRLRHEVFRILSVSE